MKTAEQLSKYISSSIKNIAELPSEDCNSIAFHMTDWLAELELIHKTFQDIESQDEEIIYQNVLKFLTHAPEHIVKASEIMTGIKIEHIFDNP